MSPADLAVVLRAALDACERLADTERADRRDWVAQAESPLGRRRHVTRVRARLAAGLPGAALLGRRALLSPDALTAELQTLGSSSPAPRAESYGDSLRRELRMVRGAP